MQFVFTWASRLMVYGLGLRVRLGVRVRVWFGCRGGFWKLNYLGHPMKSGGYVGACGTYRGPS